MEEVIAMSDEPSSPEGGEGGQRTLVCQDEEQNILLSLA